MFRRVFPKYSPYYHLVDNKAVRKVVAPIQATECVNQDEASSVFFRDEVTGFPVDVLRDVVNGENVTSPLLKPHKGTFPPSDLSDAEIMALGNRVGVDTLVEKDNYLGYVDSQVELSNIDSESKIDPEPKTDLVSKTDLDSNPSN